MLGRLCLLTACAALVTLTAPKSADADCAYPYGCFCPFGSVMATVEGEASGARAGVVEFTITAVTPHLEPGYNTFQLGVGDVLEVPSGLAADYERALIFITKRTGEDFGIEDVSPIDESGLVVCDDNSGEPIARAASDVAAAALDSECEEALELEEFGCNDTIGLGCQAAGSGSSPAPLGVLLALIAWLGCRIMSAVRSR